MSVNSLNKLLKDMHAERAKRGLPAWTDRQNGRLAVPHGFRSSFRDWAGEKTSFDKEVIDFAMAHEIPSKSQAAYRRYRALDKRSHLMQVWADYCGRSAITADAA